jgi:hypothetical protein
MRISNLHLKLISIFALVAATVVAASAQVLPYRVSDRQVQNLINRIETESNTFRADAQNSIDRSIWNGTNREASMESLLDAFETATDNLRDNFTSRRSSAADVQQVLNRALAVDRLMRNNTFSTRTESEWTQIRSDLDTLAGYYNVTSSWNGTGVVVTPTTGLGGGGWATNRYTANDRDMRTLLNRLRYRSSSFTTTFNRWSGRRGFWGTNGTNNDVVQAVADLNTALNSYSSNYNNTTARDLDTILRSAATIDAFVRSSNNLNYNVSSQWGLIRGDINTLTGYYGMTNWDWRAPVWDNTATYPVDRYPDRGNGGYGRGGFDAMITGTYRLNTSRSDNVGDVIDRSLGTSYDANGRQTQHQWLERRLASPEMIVVEKHGNQIQLASSIAQRIDLTADGSRQTETLPNGRTMTTSVTASGRELAINYEGDRSNDFYVSFTPAGRGLQVSRRIYLQNSNQTVTVNSFYDKTDDVARWDAITYTNNNTAGNYGNTNNNGYPGYYGSYPNDVWGVPNNTSLVARLDTPLSTSTVRNGDQFQMTVTSPGQYSGAIIHGTAYGNQSGSVSGRATMSFNFDSITMRNGQTYRFAGIVDGVRTLGGDTVSVNNEGQVRDTSRTNQTVQRAGIGAALGALIGAIAGGGSGAAIGAAVGAAAGGGSIVLQGRDNLELGTGTEFRITATAPNRVGAP